MLSTPWGYNDAMRLRKVSFSRSSGISFHLYLLLPFLPLLVQSDDVVLVQDGVPQVDLRAGDDSEMMSIVCLRGGGEILGSIAMLGLCKGISDGDPIYSTAGNSATRPGMGKLPVI